MRYLQNGRLPEFIELYFFKQFQNLGDKKFALQGFIRTFCEGPKQAECIRKKINKALGGPSKVPVNMMPKGMALSGTSKAD